jgi:hypothetical protein
MYRYVCGLYYPAQRRLVLQGTHKNNAGKDVIGYAEREGRRLCWCELLELMVVLVLAGACPPQSWTQTRTVALLLMHFWHCLFCFGTPCTCAGSTGMTCASAQMACPFAVSVTAANTATTGRSNMCPVRCTVVYRQYHGERPLDA